jgi:hypothetical protein
MQVALRMSSIKMQGNLSFEVYPKKQNQNLPKRLLVSENPA